MESSQNVGIPDDALTLANDLIQSRNLFQSLSPASASVSKITLNDPNLMTAMSYQDPTSRNLAIFAYLISIAEANNLGQTPAVQALKTARDAIQTTGSVDDTTFNQRLQMSTEGAYSVNTSANGPLAEIWTTVTLRIPLYCIWDCVSYVYTMCIEPLATRIQVEFHLIQFRNIVKALAYARKPPRGFSPPTVTAIWTDYQDNSQPILSAFATTAVGREGEKMAIVAARVSFISDLLTKVFNHQQQITLQSGLSKPPNYAGNCGEYLAIGMLCWNSGRFGGLCISVFGKYALEFCSWCGSLSATLGQYGVYIQDYWLASSLTDETKVVPAKVQGGYSYCMFKAEYEHL